jgi:subtilisin family serine protease
MTFQGAGDVPTPVENTFVFAGLGKPEDFATIDITRKFALIARGEITFLEKANHAIAAGAAGIVIFNNAPGLIHGSLTQDGSRLAVPVFMVEQTIGESMRDALAAAKPVSARLALKVTDYAAMDGTSMATPHVSGVVALMKGANKALTPAQVKQILQSTSHALAPNTNNEYGSGLVNANAAVQAALVAEVLPPLTPVPPEFAPVPVPVTP